MQFTADMNFYSGNNFTFISNDTLWTVKAIRYLLESLSEIIKSQKSTVLLVCYWLIIEFDYLNEGDKLLKLLYSAGSRLSKQILYFLSNQVHALNFSHDIYLHTYTRIRYIYRHRCSRCELV